MLRRTYDDQVCSLARALELVGERWTLLIVRDALRGTRRFDAFLRSLGVARNVLTDRLNRLVEHDVLRRVRYQERPERYEYVLTEKGLELAPALVTLMQWGDRHLAGESGPPMLIEHVGCGGPVVTQLVCERCRRTLDSGEVTTTVGPGAAASPVSR